MRISKTAFLSALLVSLLASCNYESESFGDFEKIFVFTDSLTFEDVRPDLERVFDHFIYTPHSERSYYLENKTFSVLKNYQYRRNLLFITFLDGKDQISKYILDILADDVIQAVKEGKVFYIFRENLFTRDQMAIILIAKNMQELKKNLNGYADPIFKQMDDYHYKRLDRIMFIHAEQKALEDYLWDELGWKIRIQHDYYIVKESEDGNFIWLRRFDPDRNMSVYRFKGGLSALTEDFILNVRDSLGTVHFEGDSVSRSDTYAIQGKFADRPALTIIGVWQNHTLYIGGPFKMYAFYDEKSGYIYMFDMSVTAPGKRKKPFLDQLDVMARTFQMK